MGTEVKVVISGDVLAGRYRLDRRIATGGMGEVWRATDTVLKRVVAVKVLRSDLSDDVGFGARFRGEARTMAALHHPGVVDVFDYGEIDQPDNGTLAYLVMAYIDGQSLRDRIAAAGRLGPAETLSVIAQAARALEAAHAAGIVHRDVKPGNLLIEPDGRVVLVDFGVAHTAAAPGLTGSDVIGTALYMAPEQVSSRQVSPATDIYALGAVAYHCLTGQPPFVADNPVAVAIHHVEDEPRPLPEAVPPAVRALVTTAMAKDPAHRYPSAATMASMAEVTYAALVARSRAAESTVTLAGPESRPTAAPADTKTKKTTPVRPRHRWATVFAAILAGLAAAAAALAFADPTGVPDPGGDPAYPKPGQTTVAPRTPGADSSSPGPRPVGDGRAGGNAATPTRPAPRSSPPADADPSRVTTRPEAPPSGTSTRPSDGGSLRNDTSAPPRNTGSPAPEPEPTVTGQPEPTVAPTGAVPSPATTTAPPAEPTGSAPVPPAG